MWLINVNTLELEEHLSPDVPYAILSHTWGPEEVGFQDFMSLNDTVREKAGFSKILETCRVAKSLELSYAWVDTCCIDKSSSAELSEAINSMFRWYELSAVCFAFIADLHVEGHCETFLENLQASRWFSRGWTLQELIAPKMVTFYNSSWSLVGSKHTLASPLASITGIQEQVLNGKTSLNKVPVGTRMSWASSRQTTRVEDSAYCLLGIFDINMPLLYGEGRKAFARLQSEIMQETNDLSLLAWTSETTDPARLREYSGCFATSPADFAACSKLSLVRTLELADEAEVVLTRTHISVTAALYPHDYSAEDDHGDERVYVLPLRCSDGGSASRPVSINIAKTPSGFVRHRPWILNVQSIGMPRFVDRSRQSVLWSYGPITTSRHLRLLRYISLEDATKLGTERFHNATFVRFSIAQSQFVFLADDTTPAAVPGAIWDELNSVFYENPYEMSFSLRMLRFNLVSSEADNSAVPLLLVSFKPRASERWAVVAHRGEDGDLWSQLGKWDSSIIPEDVYRDIFHSLLYRAPYVSPRLDNALPWIRPGEHVATPDLPATTFFHLSDGKQVKLTLSIKASDAGKGACEIFIHPQRFEEQAFQEPQTSETGASSETKLMVD